MLMRRCETNLPPYSPNVWILFQPDYCPNRRQKNLRLELYSASKILLILCPPSFVPHLPIGKKVSGAKCCKSSSLSLKRPQALRILCLSQPVFKFPILALWGNMNLPSSKKEHHIFIEISDCLYASIVLTFLRNLLPPLVTIPHDVLEVLLHGPRRHPEGARQQCLCNGIHDHVKN